MAETIKNLPAVKEIWVWYVDSGDSLEWLPTPVFLPGEFHGQRSLAGYSPWDCKRVKHDWATNSYVRNEKKQKTKTLKPLCNTRLSRLIINNFNVFIQIQVLRTEIELLSSMNPSPHFQRRDSAFTEGTGAS